MVARFVSGKGRLVISCTSNRQELETCLDPCWMCASETEVTSVVPMDRDGFLPSLFKCFLAFSRGQSEYLPLTMVGSLLHPKEGRNCSQAPNERVLLSSSSRKKESDAIG